MKIWIIVLLLIFIVGCSHIKATQPVINYENLRTAEIELPGMFCAACAYSAENVFKGMPGVIDAKVDISVKKGNVVYDPSVTTKEQLVQDGLISAYDGRVISDEKYGDKK